jgi:hypothetical protein
MNKIELKGKLDKLNVNKRSYSLNGEVLPDRIILKMIEEKCTVFYFDERGNKKNEKLFNSENEACFYILELFSKSKEISRLTGNNS